VITEYAQKFTVAAATGTGITWTYSVDGGTFGTKPATVYYGQKLVARADAGTGYTIGARSSTPTATYGATGSQTCDITFSSVTANITAINATRTINTYSVPTSGTFTGGSWTASPNPVNYDGTVTVQITLAEGYRHHANSAISVTRVGGGGTPASATGSAGDTTRTFTISNVQSPITNITVGNLAIQTFTITYSAGATPPNSGGVTGTITPTNTDTKTYGVAFNLPTGVFTTTPVGNWEQVGWSTDPTLLNRLLYHRNFSTTGTTSSTLFVPDGITTWGAGTDIFSISGTINWTTTQKQIPASVNNAVTLYPIWALAITKGTVILHKVGGPNSHLDLDSLDISAVMEIDLNNPSTQLLPSIAEMDTLLGDRIFQGWLILTSTGVKQPLVPLPSGKFKIPWDDPDVFNFPLVIHIYAIWG